MADRISTARPVRGLLRALAVLAIATTTARADAPSPRPELPRLREHVRILAGPEFEGRRGAGGRKAAAYLVDHFRAIGLEPLFGDDFEQVIPGRDGQPEMGRNVGAILRGEDPDLKDQWIIVSAHFDHLGTRGATLYPGADDNASGVAMLLEVARAFATAPERPRRSLMFIGFDLEEAGLFGSRYFVEHTPVPLDRVSLFITADMIGRSLGGVCGDRVFIMGTENATGLRPWVEESSKGLPITPGLLGSDLLLLNRSDYGPFRSRRVPYLFFSTGENPAYHTPDDVPETLDYPKVEAISRLIHRVVRRAAEAPSVPAWEPSTAPYLGEAETLRDVLATLLENRQGLRIGGIQATLIRNTLRTLDGVAERGTFTAEERTAVLRAARILLISIF